MFPMRIDQAVHKEFLDTTTSLLVEHKAQSMRLESLSST